MFPFVPVLSSGWPGLGDHDDNDDVDTEGQPVVLQSNICGWENTPNFPVNYRKALNRSQVLVSWRMSL